MKKKQSISIEQLVQEAKRINKKGISVKTAYSNHVEELFDEICEILSDAEARAIFATVLLKQRVDKRSLKPWNWRDFKATDYVARETDEPKRSRTSLKAR